MLEFFRKYERFVFFVVAVVVILSFTLFGAYSPFEREEKRADRTIGTKIDGSPLRVSEVKNMSRFISADREDSFQGRGGSPNFCNDGVLRSDLIQTGIGQLLVEEYFPLLKEEFQARLETAARFHPYSHPQAPFLSAKAVWDRFIPELTKEIGEVQKQKEAAPPFFSSLSKLYQLQSRLKPEMLRQILLYQHQQSPRLPIDQRLSYEDLSLFGFHSAADWFGSSFIDLASQFILHGAAAAEARGFRVTPQEAKGDLIRIFQESMDQIGEAGMKGGLNLHTHLQSLGFDEQSASEVWAKVLLFRRYLEEAGEAPFVDKLCYKDFSVYANQTAVVELYQAPISIRSRRDLAELEFYMKAVCRSGSSLFSPQFLPVEEVAEKYPELVETTYRGDVAEVFKKEISLRASLAQVWDWETSDPNWSALRKQFSLPSAEKKEERFQILERLEPVKRGEIDFWSRGQIVDQNPEWVREALASAPKKEKIWSVSGNKDPLLKQEGVYFQIENLEEVEGKHIVLFEKARPLLGKWVSKEEGGYEAEKNPFFLKAQEALDALKTNRADPRWVQSGNRSLSDQFKLIRKEQPLIRTSKEEWMKNQAFMMFPGLWSPIHVAEDGQVVFFYLKERKEAPASLLEQLSFGKETLGADAKRYAAENLLKTIKHKHPVAIPLQKEEE